ncbi:MAG TPA: methionine adenosyltransferase [Candidatus Limnocylindrales bacterium]|nr:methionine adenosyltransferase [Candidatus Limnocylindrales bacterium]
MDKIHIQEIAAPTMAEVDVEIVERKGLGHPDTICDLVMERISQALSQAYLKHYGRILHHNCDKGLLVAGQVERRFGGGRVKEPMRLVIGDRATLVREFDVAKLAVESAKSWLRENLCEVDPQRHVTYQVELKGGSEELSDIFRPGSSSYQANDTSAAVGYAPLSETERLVIAAEKHLNGRDFKNQFPESGSDVKVMGVRRGPQLDLTVAMPLLDRYVPSEAIYFQRKEEMRQALISHLQSRLEKVTEIIVGMNTLDRRGAGLSGMYLSVLGTSAEDADSGEVGRGNQVNGIIALNRPRGSEAAAGKNPVSHVGKIYSVLTHRLAAQIHLEVPGIQKAIVWLCSRIGDPVDQPQVASVQVALDRATTLADVEIAIRRIVARELARMAQFCQELASGKYSLC